MTCAAMLTRSGVGTTCPAREAPVLPAGNAAAATLRRGSSLPRRPRTTTDGQTGTGSEAPLLTPRGGGTAPQPPLPSVLPGTRPPTGTHCAVTSSPAGAQPDLQGGKPSQDGGEGRPKADPPNMATAPKPRGGRHPHDPCPARSPPAVLTAPWPSIRRGPIRPPQARGTWQKPPRHPRKRVAGGQAPIAPRQPARSGPCPATASARQGGEKPSQNGGKGRPHASPPNMAPGPCPGGGHHLPRSRGKGGGPSPPGADCATSSGPAGASQAADTTRQGGNNPPNMVARGGRGQALPTWRRPRMRETGAEGATVPTWRPR
ncbi:basic salivary proline-rich protein 2-like [Tiliqua scincoides]|uniref:basic salivary proline-rich protein 2-like n=1 Tax=Tiliqua scincoides TaxID=71010 RepID=UPI003461B77D